VSGTDSTFDSLFTSVPTDSSYTLEGIFTPNTVRNTLGFKIKQNLTFLKSSNVTFDYRLTHELDRTNYLLAVDLKKNNSLQHQFSGVLSTRHIEIITSRFSAKYKLKNKIENDRTVKGYEVSERISAKVLPKVLTVSLEGKYRKDTDDDITGEPIMGKSSAGHGEIKYTFSSNLSATLSGDYEKSYDETESSYDNYRVLFGGLNFTYVF
jgi:hypothetical protein